MPFKNHTINQIAFIFFVSTILSFAGCTGPASQKTKKGSLSSTKFIKYPCAVIVKPTDKQIDSMKKSVDSDAFYTAVDDNVFYTSTASAFLDSMKVKQINEKSKGVLTFKTKSGKIFKMTLDTMSWQIILFNGVSKPIVADMVNIQSDYKAYMKK